MRYLYSTAVLALLHLPMTVAAQTPEPTFADLAWGSDSAQVHEALLALGYRVSREPHEKTVVFYEKDDLVDSVSARLLVTPAFRDAKLDMVIVLVNPVDESDRGVLGIKLYARLRQKYGLPTSSDLTNRANRSAEWSVEGTRRLMFNVTALGVLITYVSPTHPSNRPRRSAVEEF